MSERPKDLVRRMKEKREQKTLETKTNLRAQEMREDAFKHEWERLGHVLRQIFEEPNQKNAGVSPSMLDLTKLW